MTWKWSTAKGETMEMQMAFPDVPVTTADIVSAARREKNAWASRAPEKRTAKGTKQMMRNIAAQQL